jgi:transcriptional regulator with XRE-family HTH domain
MAKIKSLVQIGSRIRAIREARGISQEQMAMDAGLDRAYYGRIERGEVNVAALNLLKIASHWKPKSASSSRKASAENKERRCHPENNTAARARRGIRILLPTWNSLLAIQTTQECPMLTLLRTKSSGKLHQIVALADSRIPTTNAVIGGDAKLVNSEFPPVQRSGSAKPRSGFTQRAGSRASDVDASWRFATHTHAKRF